MDANLAAMFGLAAEAIDLDRADMMRFAHPGDQSRASEVLAAAVASGQPYADEMLMLTAQNEERWFVTRGARLEGTEKVVGVIRDVTQRRSGKKRYGPRLKRGKF